MELELANKQAEHEKTLERLKQQYSIEKESWEEMYMRKQTHVLKEKV